MVCAWSDQCGIAATYIPIIASTLLKQCDFLVGFGFPVSFYTPPFGPILFRFHGVTCARHAHQPHWALSIKSFFVFFYLLVYSFEQRGAAAHNKETQNTEILHFSVISISVDLILHKIALPMEEPSTFIDATFRMQRRFCCRNWIDSSNLYGWPSLTGQLSEQQ